MTAPGHDWYDTASTPRDQIIAYARKVLAEFEATDVWAPAAQLRAASVHAANEYAGRFLLELLQNAHDTHPADRHDGRITIVVDADEGAHGVVYVANDGTPFTHQSMAGLCKLARSPKQVGQGIGHKGVGFRSVLPVCTWPEIYSADPAGPPGNLDGYSFRFAAYPDLLDLADGDQALARRADTEFPPFQLPVPVDTVPDVVRDLAATGHVTVIRLVLDTPEACVEAIGQAEGLVADDVPTLLFLERIASLTVIRRDQGESNGITLTRTQHDLALTSDSDVSFTHVDLGHLGGYTVVSAAVAAARLRGAVQDARHTKRMSDEWTDWHEAVVSLAVPAQGEVSGRMFTFLPMGGKAPSPFAGHLNAPFFTKIDRADLDPDHPLNSLLLDVAAETALVAAEVLRTCDDDATRRWVGDLVCWEGPHLDRLVEAAKRFDGDPLENRRFVPVEATSDSARGWATLVEAYCWPAQGQKVITAARAAQVGTCLLDSTIGWNRAERWESFADSLYYPLRPSISAMAKLVEKIAAGLERPSEYVETDRQNPKARKKKTARKPVRARRATGDVERAALWAGFYSDLAAMFPKSAELLRGRMLLVDDAGELRQTNTAPQPPGKRTDAKRVNAFLPPFRDETPITAPASLRKHLFFLHPAIAEKLDSAGRGLLLQAGLAHTYDIRNLLDHVGTVLATTESERTHRDALRFVFTLDRNGQVPPSYRLRELHLQVPTTAGTVVPAARTVFGPGWEHTKDIGADLITVIEDARDLDHDTAELGKRFVDPGPDLIRPADDIQAWFGFLTKIGVGKNLPIRVTVAPTPKPWGSQLNDPGFAKICRVPDAVAKQWAAHLASLPRRYAAYPQTEYVASRKPAWVLGQTIAEQLTEPARAAYARLVLRGLTHWSQDLLTVHWDRDRRGDKDRQTVPSPLAAFLTTAAWLPAAPRPDRPAFARPDRLWHFPLSSDDAEPSFAPLLDRVTRRFLDRNPKTLLALKAAGLGVWSDPAHAARLVRDLGESAAAGAVGDGQRDQFLRAYLRAWSDVANQAKPGLVVTDDLPIVLEVGSRLSVRRISDLISEDVTVYLVRPGDGLHLRLLRDLELPVLFVHGDVEKVRALLADELGDHVRVADESAVTVSPTGVSGPDVLLVEGLRWLAILVAVAADQARGLTLRERDFEDLARGLRRLRVRSYTALNLRVFDQPTELPAAGCGMFADPDDGDPVVLSPTAVADIRGSALVALAEEVAAAVGFAGLRERLRAAVLDLQRDGDDRPEPDDADLARALRLSTAQVAATRARLDGGLEAVLGRLHPVLVHFAGGEAADAAVDNARASGEMAELSTSLRPLAPTLPVAVAVDTLVDMARTASTTEEIRVGVGIGFAEFNTTLAGLGRHYAPLSRQEAHEQALRQHLAVNRQRLIDRLRWARLAHFDDRRPQPDWPDLRTFDWVAVPADWGTTVYEVTRAELTGLVDDAAQALLGRALPDLGPALPALGTVTAANKALVTRIGPDIARLARAWATAHRSPLVEQLTSDDTGTAITALLDRNGALDFRRLDQDDIPAWLDVLGWWPTGMPRTTDRDTAGVTAEQLAAADSAVTAARRERERRRRLITIGDRTIDVGVGAADLTALVDTLQTNLAANPAVIAAPNRIAGLSPMAPTRPRNSAGAGGRDPMAGLSDEQRQALGFAGEWLAYQWLLRVYPEANESSWVSTNRQRVFAGDLGDDRLGYDFRVERAPGSLMFEVKASRDTPGSFILTDSEIREARRHARDGRWRLLIVPYVSDPARCRVLRLPNPFEARAEGMFRPGEQGIRYHYNLNH
ncbi:sacsin N-terminal ATP-binding-like domain-containing protein [Actinosynnema sp. CA-248983]